jgi:hypothetical protein
MARLQRAVSASRFLQPESKLVASDPFRAPSELRALEPPDDEPESLDLSLHLGKLGSIVRHLSQVRHQLAQRGGK